MAATGLIPDKPNVPGDSGKKPPEPGRPGGPPIPGYGYYPVFPTTNAYGQPYELIIDANTLTKGKGKSGKKADARQMQVAGAGTVIRIVYGEQRVGGSIIAWGINGGKLILALAWCEGVIEGVQSYTVNDEAPSGVTAAHYDGSQTTPDPTLVALRSSQGHAFSDTYTGVAYSVFQVSSRKSTGFPRFNAIIRGKKVASVEGGAHSYSECPAYIVADFIEHHMQETVDWATVAAVAAWNNEMIGTPAEVRNRLSISVDQVQIGDSWLDVLCDYAGCFWTRDNGTIKLVPDSPAATEFAIGPENMVAESVTLEQRDSTSSPTVVQCVYTDRTQLPWRDEIVTVYAPGVLAGTEERRVSRVSRPGITRYSEAYRYALQRLNEFLTSDLVFTGVLFDEAIQFLPGTRLAVTHPLGITNKEMRIVGSDQQSQGRWLVRAVEYDPAKWSSVVATGPSTPDTVLPSPLDVPAVTGFAVVEEIVQIQTGRWASRLVFTWDTPTVDDYIYLTSLTIQVKNGDNVQSFTVPPDPRTFTTPALPENINYECSIFARSELEVGATSTLFITNNGKQAVPSDVPSISAYSVDGETHIKWEPATDLDITSYELRYSDQLTTVWEGAAFLAFVAFPGVNYSTTLIPVGARRVWIKAHDSVMTDIFPNGQESVNAIYVDLDVVVSTTSNSAEFPLTDPTLSNMVDDGAGGWMTSVGTDAWDSLFPAALDSYTNPLNTYHSSADSSLVSGTIDILESQMATVVVDGMDYDDISGTGQQYIEYKENAGDAWTRVDGTTATVQGRYFRAGIEWEGSETGVVHDLGVMRINVDATSRFIRDTVLNDTVGWIQS